MNTTNYTCSICGKQHEEWPALAFNAPQAYLSLSEREKEAIADLIDDFCVIRHQEQTYWLITNYECRIANQSETTNN